MTSTTTQSLIFDLVIVSGEDAGEYLQTQLTQDVLKLEVGDSAWSFLLKPKSEIVALMRVARTAEMEYTLEMESGWGDTVRQTIDEFLGRMDISFEQRTVEADVEDEQDRIARGWPRLGREIDGSVTPVMTGIVAQTIAFEKGCYAGQEFVARVHYRDAAPTKRLVHLAFDGNVRLSETSPIVIDGDDVGTVTSVARGIALGYLKRGVDTPASGTVADVAVELLAIRAS
jgi:hypothetical protein